MAIRGQRKSVDRKARRPARSLDVKDLRYFVAVYEAGGFSRASEALGTVQSNVSARILALERSVGARLFERRWRNVLPTRRGDKLYAYAKKLLTALRNAERTFRA